MFKVGHHSFLFQWTICFLEYLVFFPCFSFCCSVIVGTGLFTLDIVPNFRQTDPIMLVKRVWPGKCTLGVMAQMTFKIVSRGCQQSDRYFFLINHKRNKTTWNSRASGRKRANDSWGDITFARSCCGQTHFQRHPRKCCSWLNLNLHSVSIFLLSLTPAPLPRHTNYLTQQMLRSDCLQCSDAQITNSVSLAWPWI